MKKQTEQKPERVRVRCTVWMHRDVWLEARKTALDRGVSFGELVEDALVAYLKGGKS
jgi:hypothetical protein